MKLNFIEKRFSDLSRIQYKLYLAESQQVSHRHILMIKFIGEYRFGSSGNPDVAYMNAIATAALRAWHPDALVIDFSELKYEWGDELEWIFPNENGEFDEAQVPTVVVVGLDCREAVRTLIFGINSSETLAEISWIYEDLGQALEYIEQKLEKTNE